MRWFLCPPSCRWAPRALSFALSFSFPFPFSLHSDLSLVQTSQAAPSQCGRRRDNRFPPGPRREGLGWKAGSKGGQEAGLVHLFLQHRLSPLFRPPGSPSSLTGPRALCGPTSCWAHCSPPPRWDPCPSAVLGEPPRAPIQKPSPQHPEDVLWGWCRGSHGLVLCPRPARRSLAGFQGQALLASCKQAGRAYSL